jgi:hypothetical protein
MEQVARGKQDSGMQTDYSKVADAFAVSRPVIERGLELMQCREKQQAKQVWQELVSMVEAEDEDVEKFARKLGELYKIVREYDIRSQELSSDLSIRV